MHFRIIILSIIGILISQFLTAQVYDYDFAIGARMGLAYGVSAKYFLQLRPAIRARHAIESMITTRYNGANGSVVYEYHIDIFDTKGLNLYFGGGVHFAIWNSDEVKWDTQKHGYKPYTGLDGIIGIEYVIADIPVSIGLDWKPAVNFISDLNLMIDDLALSVRFLFK